MVTEAALAGAAAAGAAEGAGAVAAGAGASAAGAGAAGGASAGGAGAAASGAGSAAGGAGATGASAAASGAGAETTADTALGASSVGASETSGVGAETIKDVPKETESGAISQGADQVEGPDATGGEESLDTTTDGENAPKEEKKKKGFGSWADNVFDKYNQLHGGEAEGWGKKNVWEKVGTTLNNAYKDYSVGSAAVNKITPPNAGVPGGLQAPQVQTVQQVSSDEELKDVISEDVDPIDCFAQIDSYLYRYKPEVVEKYNGHENGSPVNDDQNFGVMAQDLQANPLTAPAVKEDENGYLMLDGGRLSSINTAMIAELCKKVQELEEYIYGRK